MKILAIVSEDSVLQGLLGKIDAVEERAQQTRKFLEKQVDTAFEQYKKELDPIWDDIANHLKASGKLDKNYTRENGVLTYSKDADALAYMTMNEKQASKGLHGLLAKLLDSLK